MGALRLLGLAMVLLAGAPAWADSVSGHLENGYARLSFDTQAKLGATTTGGVLDITFSRKTDLSPAQVIAVFPQIIASGRADVDGKSLRFVLKVPVKLHISQLGEHAVLDLAPTDFTGKFSDLAPPAPKPKAKPVDPASLPQIKLRVGSYSNFTRLVFDWPKDVSYRVNAGGGKMSIRFEAPVRMDVSAIARFSPPWVKNAAWRIDGESTLVELQTDLDSGYHDFKDGTHVVVDILAPKTDSAAYVPPGDAKPSVTAISQGASLAKPGAPDAQIQAVLQAAAQLNPKPKTAPQKSENTQAKTEKDQASAAKQQASPDKSSSAAQPSAAVPPALSIAQARRTGNGVRITFKGAGGHGVAIFVRGLTAWIILENAPNFDSQNLKASLGDFAQGVEAIFSDGLGILRITLKQPAAIAAQGLGPNLRVEIAPSLGPAPTAIGFARNQADPNRATLTTLLPAADRAFQVLDPQAGDLLTIVPCAAGNGMVSKRDFADFAALPTAAGLVITPYTDDLSVQVAQSRITISRPGGLSLTPPQMPVAQTPSALAHFGDGPSYLDFAKWGKWQAGSFLATQRSLAQAPIRLQPAQANEARLTLARFYLANEFAAEALGMLDLVQAHDPALTGDAQLVTMRAAAEYMMGRYSDAHKELDGPSFDSDRHAALWRGLIEAGMEDWKDAHIHLEQAFPVMARYPTSWQARAYLADAKASLGMGRLDLADSVLTRLPKSLSPTQALTAELMQARLLADQSRYRDSLLHFERVENGGNEALAVRAIFYQTNAALSAGAINAKEAIAQLERLRFRWRGDALELQTLRKLASLYFGLGRWRDGLRTLRVATQNFAGQDQARIAQDDMRAAFAKLFLTGGADKMKPIDALSLFYDNIDLTPIGPDGDEMIRRMCDRLVAVDLLGPAATLLDYQVQKRLDGIAKAQVASRLAAIYLMDHKPEKALDVIRQTQITGLPDDEMHSRMILEARAFAAMKEWDNALDLIALDQSDEARRLRADIYWESGNWAVAGQKAEELLGTRWNDPGPLSQAERAQVLRAAVAYSLANDEDGLSRIRDHFNAQMHTSPDANLFKVLSADIDAHGLAFRQAAAKIAAIDTMEAFMRDLTRRKDAKS